MSSVEEIARRLDELEKRFAVAERERDEYRALYLLDGIRGDVKRVVG